VGEMKFQHFCPLEKILPTPMVFMYLLQSISIYFQVTLAHCIAYVILLLTTMLSLRPFGRCCRSKNGYFSISQLELLSHRNL